MHGINHLLSHHHGSDNNDGSDTRSSSASSDIRNHDTRFLQELLSQKHDNRLYFHERQVSRGSVSSAYSYGSSSYGSSYGSNSSNHHYQHHHHHHHHHHQSSLYSHTIHGNNHRTTSNGKASPSSPSPTNEHEKQHHHHHHHHHHHKIQEMIRHFGRRLGHIRRQSECHESPKEREEDFRNRSQSLDGGVRYSASLREADCETTYRIYESILRQGSKLAREND